MLADASLPARERLQPDANRALRVVVDGEAAAQVTVVTPRSEATVVVLRSDYFSRSDARERAFIADASYSNSKTPGREPQSQTPPDARAYTARSSAQTYTQHSIALYERIEGTAANAYKGTHIDIFV